MLCLSGRAAKRGGSVRVAGNIGSRNGRDYWAASTTATPAS